MVAFGSISESPLSTLTTASSGGGGSPLNQFISQTLSLSQDVSRNLNYHRFAFDTLELTDSALKVLHEDVEHTLTLTHDLLQVTEDQAASQELTLSQSVHSNKVYTRHLEHTLSLSQRVNRVIDFDPVHTLNLSQSLAVSTFELQALTQSLNLSHDITTLLNLESEGAQALTLSQSVSYVLLAQQNVSQQLDLNQAVSIFNFRQQNPANSLQLGHTVSVSNFAAQLLSEQLNLTQELDHRVLPAIDEEHDLELSDIANYTIFPAGITYSLLNLGHTLRLNRVINVSVCSCLHLTHKLKKAVEAEAEDTLDLTDEVSADDLAQRLRLTQAVETNVIYDPCCGSAYIPDKWVKNTLELTHSVRLNRVININVVQSLNLQQTVVYL